MCVTTGQRIGGDADVEMVFVVPTLSKFLATLRVSMVAKDLETWQKLLELHLPVQEDTGRHDDQVRSPDTTITG